jgi:hypothetical protein
MHPHWRSGFSSCEIRPIYDAQLHERAALKTHSTHICSCTVDYNNGKQKTHQLITLYFLQLKLYFVKKKHTYCSEITCCHYLQFFIAFFKFNFALWALPESHDKAVPKYQSKVNIHSLWRWRLKGALKQTASTCIMVQHQRAKLNVRYCLQTHKDKKSCLIG